MTTTWARTAAMAVVAAVVGGLATSPSADAHTVSGVTSTNYESVALPLSPPLPSVAFRLRDLGRRVELRNTSRQAVVVLGYQGEPYLRVGPSGAEENLHSPTLYKNRMVSAGSAPDIPPDATPTAVPMWQRTSTAGVVRWRDQRTRHEGATPTEVRQDPRHRHVVGTWAISLQQESAPIIAAGIIRWVPPPSPLPWLLAAAAVVVAVAVAGLGLGSHRVVAAAIAASVGVDVVHAVVAVLPAADSGPQAVIKLLLGGLVSVLAWAAGGAAAVILGQGNPDGLFLAVFAAAVFLLTGGVGDLSVLGHSQIPYAVAPAVARALVSLTLGLGTGVLFVSIRDRGRTDGQRRRT